MKLLDLILGRGSVDAEHATAIAVSWAEAHALRFEPPYRVVPGFTTYRVISNANALGGNAHVEVRRKDGIVIGSGGPTPR
jgi:hypothetical protein